MSFGERNEVPNPTTYTQYPQACTEMIMPFCTNGVDDIFEPFPWDFESYAQQCAEYYGVKPTTDAIEKAYGGKNLKAASNIVFR